jgi:hypothetical protein
VSPDPLAVSPVKFPSRGADSSGRAADASSRIAPSLSPPSLISHAASPGESRAMPLGVLGWFLFFMLVFGGAAVAVWYFGYLNF